MTPHKLFFISSNSQKLADILDQAGKIKGIDIEHINWSSPEWLSQDLGKLTEKKAESAFEKFHRPLFVDHTSLKIDALGGLPGPASSFFWEALRDDICRIVHAVGPPQAKMTVCLAYTEGKRIYSVSHTVTGHVAEQPVGDRSFSWDRIFIPDGETKTFGQMSVAEKNKFSPRSRAFSEMITDIKVRLDER
ncbi:hypothetical protein BTR14_06345 [Rhizobium rhizosphaerae]|uniref:Non-canonical purine NTP pyrophosphatase n=1 Tax=Xaviernesmea rhizosphaerae TaxID=1672749 RepID=A0ABX3PF71_9HYPH|nr:non-canonical purine NTP pyrophosphatase [Xaviernesmea rhizosphaerae]OQP87057.1 hypothetical protein BTR14_06345 [Xaviernesmea rhizosphaerae]